jgi:cytochrome c-type biogenesis protein CcmH/NrfG
MMPRAVNCVALALMIFTAGPWASSAAAPAPAKVSPAVLKRDTARCTGQADIDACYDALRWQPSDPALLVGLGDALRRANRSADALRNYQRAAELAPTMRGLSAKISATQASLHAKHPVRSVPAEHASGSALPARHYSNAAPVAQSH